MSSPSVAIVNQLQNMLHRLYGYEVLEIVDHLLEG
jgi:hypothetical protein